MIRLDFLTSQKLRHPTGQFHLPVVRLPDSLLPATLRGSGVVLEAILGFYTPTLNIKYIPASWMLKSMLAGSRFKRAYMLVENSSGNFALSLAACARTQGFEVTAIVSDNIAAGKLPPLRASGVHIIRESEAVARLKLERPCGGARMAELLAEKEGWINLGQYSNTRPIPKAIAVFLRPNCCGRAQGKSPYFARRWGPPERWSASAARSSRQCPECALSRRSRISARTFLAAATTTGLKKLVSIGARWSITNAMSGRRTLSARALSCGTSGFLPDRVPARRCWRCMIFSVARKEIVDCANIRLSTARSMPCWFSPTRSTRILIKPKIIVRNNSRIRMSVGISRNRRWSLSS